MSVFWVYLALCGILGACQAKHLTLDQKIDKIDEFMNGILECRKTPSYSIAVVQNGTVVLARGYGYADVENQVHATEDTRFLIASIGKSFTATYLTKIFAENEQGVDWDTPVSEVLGEGFHFQNGYRTNVTTSRDLVSHQSGIPGYDAIWLVSPFTSKDTLLDRIRFMEPAGELRRFYWYNSMMYAVIERVGETLTGETRRDFMTQQMFAPLGMTTTSFYETVVANGYQDAAQGYDVNDRIDGQLPLRMPMEAHRALSKDVADSSGDVFISATDMAKWMNFVLSDGKTPDGIQLVNSEYMEKLYNPEAAYELYSEDEHLQPNVPFTDVSVNYGYGYDNGYYRGWRYYGHSGSMNGFNSEVTYMKHHNLGVFMANNLSNYTSENRYIHDFIIDVMLGEDPWIDVKGFCERLNQQYHKEEVMTHSKRRHDRRRRPSQKRAPCAASAVTLADRDRYVGVYGDFVFGNVTISWNEELDSLFFEIGDTSQWTLEKTAEEEHSFEAIWANNATWAMTHMDVYFYDENDGKMDTLNVSDFEWNAPPYFQRGRKMSDAPPPNTECV